MCNLYSLDKGQDAIRKACGVDRDETGNLPPMPGIFPDQMAPVVHLADGELSMMRWGFPSPTSKGPQHPVTNVRNVKSPYWRPWLKAEQRCLVPVSSFSEYADTKSRKTPVWFALDKVLEVGPLEKGLAVAGIVDLIVRRDHRIDFVSASAHGLRESGPELARPCRALDPGLVQGLTRDAVGRLSDRRQDEPSAPQIVLNTLCDRCIEAA